MEQRKPTEQNRVARDLDVWKRIEDKLTQRYGRRIVYDRDFLKAKRSIYKHIRDKHKGKPLNLFEKAEMQILRGQRRDLLRQLYPNPFNRLTRNILVFAGNVLQLTGRLAWQLTKSFATPVPGRVITPTYAGTASREQKELDETKAARQKQQTRTAVSQAKAVVRKLPIKSRVQMTAARSKGMRR